MDKQNEIIIHHVEGYGGLWFMSSPHIKNLSLASKEKNGAIYEARKKEARFIHENIFKLQIK